MKRLLQAVGNSGGFGTQTLLVSYAPGRRAVLADPSLDFLVGPERHHVDRGDLGSDQLNLMRRSSAAVRTRQRINPMSRGSAADLNNDNTNYPAAVCEHAGGLTGSRPIWLAGRSAGRPMSYMLLGSLAARLLGH